MNEPILKTAAFALALTASSAHAAVLLVNFGDTVYTTDGANTWQTIDLVAANTISNNGGTLGPSQTRANTGLVTTVNAISGITLQVSAVVTQAFSALPYNGLFDNAGAGATQFAAPVSGINYG